MKKMFGILFAIALVATTPSVLPVEVASATSSPVVSANTYNFYQNGKFIKEFRNPIDAINYSKGYANSFVSYRGNTIWSRDEKRKASTIINAPLVAQMPELPRGCEVTSLAMMLSKAGVQVSKTKLAKEIKRDTTPYKKVKGQVYFGNPYNGFVGDMYSLKTPGYGVYHGPIKELAEKYLPNRVVDLTGASFDDVLFSVHRGKPVWVISNGAFNTLPTSSFQTWNTPTGKVRITMREHAVLVTGYDSKYIYFNDPLAKMKNRKVLKTNFKAAWEQMGKQAITYI